MSKSFLAKFLIALSIVAVAVFWLLSFFVEAFKPFNASWAIAIVSGMIGIVFVCVGMFSKKTGIQKKLYIFGGAGLILICVLCLINIFAISNEIVLPVIAVVVAVAIALSVLVVGGKKWDQGDNQNAGYKNYYQRKAEQEKLDKKENKDNK